MSLLNSYVIGFYFGRFIGGALLCGLIPFIIFAVKKRWGAAFGALIICGVAGLLHIAAAIVAGVIFLIVAIVSTNNRTGERRD